MTFDQAKAEALRQLEKGDFFEARKHINAMERLAQSVEENGRAKIYLASCAKDLGHYEWSLQLFTQASTVLDGNDKESKNWDMYLLNLADLYCCLHQPVLAELLTKELLQRHADDRDFYYCWGIFEQGRICLLRSQYRQSIRHLRHAVTLMGNIKDKANNYVGWFECWLGIALVGSGQKDRDEGISILMRLVDRWGPDRNPRDPEIYATAALTIGQTENERTWLAKAEYIARKKGYRHIMQSIEESNNNSVPHESRSSVTSRVFYFLVVWLLVQMALPIATAWAKSGLEKIPM